MRDTGDLGHGQGERGSTTAVVTQFQSPGLAACGALRLKEGSLYPALYRLENAGLVEATWEEETKGRRGARRRIYRLTTKGTKALTTGRETWQHFVKIIGGILGTPA